MLTSKKKILITLFIILLVIAGSLFWAYNRLNHFFYSASLPVTGEQVIIEIPLGSSTASIAQQLEQENVISNSLLFRLFVRYKGLDGQLKAGEYAVSSSMSIDELVHKLTEGVVYKAGNRFTFPEGLTIEALGNILTNNNLVSQEDFWSSVESGHWTEEFSFLPQEEDFQGDYILEGYLFPDTYEIDKGATSSDIIRLMLRRFENIFYPELAQRAEEMNMSLHQVVTLASIVEREGKVDEERPLIAAVFHNRLQRDFPMNLESCATVQYALGEVKPALTYQDLEIESPYNTYRNSGLPPGPIGAPGKASLEATLYPKDVDYLFFVYKEDGSGTHYFSETLQQHNQYRAKARQNR